MSKLVRDKIPELVPNRKFYRAGSSVGLFWLNLKLLEEAEEVNRATDKFELIEELADLYAVMKGVMKHADISPGELREAVSKKSRERGEFDQLWIMED